MTMGHRKGHGSWRHSELTAWAWGVSVGFVWTEGERQERENHASRLIRPCCTQGGAAARRKVRLFHTSCIPPAIFMSPCSDSDPTYDSSKHFPQGNLRTSRAGWEGETGPSPRQWPTFSHVHQNAPEDLSEYRLLGPTLSGSEEGLGDVHISSDARATCLWTTLKWYHVALSCSNQLKCSIARNTHTLSLGTA